MTARIKELRVIREDWRSVNQHALHGRLREEDPACYSLELKLLADRAFLEGFKLWLSQQRVDFEPGVELPALTSGAPRLGEGVVDGELLDEEPSP